MGVKAETAQRPAGECEWQSLPATRPESHGLSRSAGVMLSAAHFLKIFEKK